jgi:TetR/AcrR family transcriptional regulator, transcriptional repressor of bet genes
MTTAAPRQRLRPDERRQRLIEATLRTLARHGAKGAGVRQVCRELGVAPSLVAHFFAGWSDLLAAAYEAMADELLDALEHAAAAPAASPRERLRAMIECYLSPEALADDSIGAYLALWALSRTDVDLRTAFARFHEARAARFTLVIADLAGETRSDLDLCARSLVVILDGFWLELGTNKGSIPREQAVAMGMAWVEMQLGGGARSGRT